MIGRQTASKRKCAKESLNSVAFYATHKAYSFCITRSTMSHIYKRNVISHFLRRETRENQPTEQSQMRLFPSLPFASLPCRGWSIASSHADPLLICHGQLARTRTNGTLKITQDIRHFLSRHSMVGVLVERRRRPPSNSFTSSPVSAHLFSFIPSFYLWFAVILRHFIYVFLVRVGFALSRSYFYYIVLRHMHRVESGRLDERTWKYITAIQSTEQQRDAFVSRPSHLGSYNGAQWWTSTISNARKMPPPSDTVRKNAKTQTFGTSLKRLRVFSLCQLWRCCVS